MSKYCFFTHNGVQHAVWAWGGKEIAVVDLGSNELVQVIKSSRPEMTVDPGNEEEGSEPFVLEALSGLRQAISHVAVAAVSKDIVAFAPNSEAAKKPDSTLLVYGLSTRAHLNGVDADVTAVYERRHGKNLQRPADQVLHWTPYWKCEGADLMIPISLNGLALSPFGDCLVIAQSFMSLWTRDRAASFAYSVALAYGPDLPKDAYAPAKKEAPIGAVDSISFSPDARVIATLEDKRQVCLYYNADLSSNNLMPGSVTLEDPYPQAEGSFASIENLERIELPANELVDSYFFVKSSPMTIVTAGKTEWNLFIEDTTISPDFSDCPPPHPSCKTSLFTVSHHARIPHPGLVLQPIYIEDKSEIATSFDTILLPKTPLLYGKVVDTDVRRKMIEAEQAFDSMQATGGDESLSYVGGWGKGKQIVWQLSETGVTIIEQMEIQVDYKVIRAVMDNDELGLIGTSDCPPALHSGDWSLRSPHLPDIAKSVMYQGQLIHLTASHLILSESAELTTATDVLPSSQHLLLKDPSKLWIHLPQTRTLCQFDKATILDATLILSTASGTFYLLYLMKDRFEVVTVYSDGREAKVILSKKAKEVGADGFLSVLAADGQATQVEVYKTPPMFGQIVIQCTKNHMCYCKFDLNDGAMTTKLVKKLESDCKYRFKFSEHQLLVEVSQPWKGLHNLHTMKQYLDVAQLVGSVQKGADFEFSGLLKDQRVLVASHQQLLAIEDKKVRKFEGEWQGALSLTDGKRQKDLWITGGGVWNLDIGEDKLKQVSDVAVLSQMVADGKLDLVKGLLGRLRGESMLDIEHLLDEMETFLANQVQDIGEKQKKDPVSDFFGGDSDDDGELIDFDEPAEAKEEKKAGDDDNLVINQLIEVLQQYEEKTPECLQLLKFALKFKAVHKKDFYSDDQATKLLRGLHFEHTNVQASLGEAAQKDEQADVVKLLTAAEIRQAVYEDDDGAEQIQDSGDPNAELRVPISRLQPWTSLQVAQAHFSVNQEEILTELNNLFAFESEATWQHHAKICLPLWVQTDIRLKAALEPLARVEYKKTKALPFKIGEKPESAAGKVAIYYVLMDMKDRLIKLYEAEGADGLKVANLLREDFTTDKWKKTARKNAAKLYKLKRLDLAMAFYLLGEDVRGAVQLAAKGMNDQMLALLICRLMRFKFAKDPAILKEAEEEMEKVLNGLIKRARQEQDRYLEVMALWNMPRGSPIAALNALQIQPNDYEDYSAFLSAAPEFNMMSEQAAKNEYPIPTKSTGPEVISLVTKLKKAPTVVKYLAAQNQSSSGYGAAADFDDFFSDKKKEDSKKDVVKEEIKVTEGLVLAQVLETLINNERFREGVLLLREMRDQIDASDLRLVSLIVDVLEGAVLREAQRNRDNSKDMDQLLRRLAEFITGSKGNLHLQKAPTALTKDHQMAVLGDLIQRRAIKQLLKKMERKGIDYLRYSTELRLSRSHELMPSPEMYMVSLFSQLEQHEDVLNVKFQPIVDMQAAVEEMEKFLDCLIIVDHFDYQSASSGNEGPWFSEAIELWFYAMEKKGPEAEQPKEEAKKSAVDDFFGADSDDDEEESSEGDLFAVAAKSQKAKPVAAAGPSTLLKTDLPKEQDLSPQIKLAFKLRLAICLITKLVLMATQSKQLLILKEILQDDGCLNEFFGKLDNIKAMSAKQVEDLNDSLRFQGIKMLLLKLKSGLDSPKKGFEELLLEASSSNTGLGQLIQSKQIGYETFIFAQKFLQVVLMNSYWQKLSNVFYKHNKEVFTLIHQDLLETQLTLEMQKCGKNKDWQKVLDTIDENLDGISIPAHQFNLKSLLTKLNNHRNLMEVECQKYFESRLNIKQKFYITSQLQQSANSIILQQFFEERDKSREFYDSMEIQKYAKQLQEFYLTYLAKSNTTYQAELDMIDGVVHREQIIDQKSPIRRTEDEQIQYLTEPATQYLLAQQLGTGIELFKQKSEEIRDFAIDRSNTSKNVALGLMTSGIREFPLKSALEFRQRLEKNRAENGLMLIDEENLTWEECLHRYEPIEFHFGQQEAENEGWKCGLPKKPQLQIYSESEPINMTINALFANRSLLNRHQQVPGKYPSKAVRPYSQWNGSEVGTYLRQTSRLDISHEDPTYAVESHPHIPLYATGNRKGIICMWNFNQQEDKSLYQFMPEVHPKDADIRRHCISKIRFNNYGDRIFSSNMEGNLTIFQVETGSKIMRKMPIFSLQDSPDLRISDFDLLSDSVVVTLKDKKLRIYDTMLPYSGKAAMQHEFKLAKTGGNILLVNKRRQTVCTFNGRTGAMSEFDLRKNLQFLNQIQLSESQEVTAACLSPNHDSLITGYKNGQIKVHRVANNFLGSRTEGQDDLVLREEIMAFGSTQGKKGHVTSIKLMGNAVFASSQAGVLKLLRTSI